MNLWKRLNEKGDKIYYHYDFGRGPGQRPATGIFTYRKPKDQIQKNHNKEALALLEVKVSECTLDMQATGSSFIPARKFESNFFDYYERYVKENKRDGNRHLRNSLTHFKKFLGKDFIAPVDITENLCSRYQRYLLDNFNGDTPANYFTRFKQVVRSAAIDGYYRFDPSEKVPAKSNPCSSLKEHLEVEEYLALLQTPCFNEHVKEAFIFCCYTGLRFVDVKVLDWEHIEGRKLITRIIQAKTGQPLCLTLHPIALAIIEKRRLLAKGAQPKDRVFGLPTHDGSNKVLKQWVQNSGIGKEITWSCARLSFSILLKDKNVDDPTIAALLGHTTTKQVQRVYKRHRPKDESQTISELPSPDILPTDQALKTKPAKRRV
ncbi:MAG: site-specific integrase [Filimonas sp.]|nr:site-specific integrase [Filimonas sp.]